MKRLLLCSAAGLLVFLVSVTAASAFGWKDVVKMRQAGIADSLILQKIEYSGTTFHLNADEMEALKEAGVSDALISAMLRTEAEDEDDDGGYRYDDYGYHGYYGYYGHPYYPYYYPHSRIYVRLGLGYYGPYPRYYDTYRYPRYHPYYYKRTYYGGHRSWKGDYGTTRVRTRVGDRIDTHNRGFTGYRARTNVGSPRPGSSSTRIRHR
jgi:hypothetical protein